MKLIMTKLTILIYILSILTNTNYVQAVEYSEVSTSLKQNLSKESAQLEIQAKSGVLIESTTGTILFEKSANEKMPPASITKIMTMILVMEKLSEGSISLTDQVTASEHASSMGGSQIWLEPGEKMTIDDLLKATAISSANDAAVALAEYTYGSEQVFVAKMNEKAKELGMENTTFMNSTGLDAEGHLSTAYDIALMSRELLKHKEVLNYTTKWMDSLRQGKTELVNTNKLVRFYNGATGLKTGTTDGAGSCLSASATRDGMELIAVTMGSDTSKERFAAASSLLDYGFSTFEMYIPEYKENIDPLKLKFGIKDSVELKVDMPQNGIVIKKGTENKLVQELEIQQDITAPVEENQIVGKILISINGNIIYEMNVSTKENVARIDFLSALCKLLTSLFST